MSCNDCPNCNGTGYMARPIDAYGVAFMRAKCPECVGTGQSDKIGVEVSGTSPAGNLKDR